jgi:endoglucanase
MPTIGYRILAASLALMLLAAAGEPPAALRRGVNVTHWFRFPPNRDPGALRGYLSDTALDELKRLGFTFVRLPVQPDLLEPPSVLADAVARVQRHGLAVVVALFADDWRLETEAADRAKLLTTWRSLALALRPLDPAATFPELLNEPVFAAAADAWARLQHQAVLTIRTTLPSNTIVLTGADWGGIAGLLSLPPESDPNVIYSFHLYEPAELTALGAYRPGLDAASMARLPFPVVDQAGCRATAASAHDPPTADLMRLYCSQRWDAAKLGARVTEVGAWARQHHVAVLAGEFGASERLNGSARLAWLPAAREACEHEAIGWALWGYDDSMGFALHPPGDRRRIDPAVSRALGLTTSSNREALPRLTPIAASP